MSVSWSLWNGSQSPAKRSPTKPAFPTDPFQPRRAAIGRRTTENNSMDAALALSNFTNQADMVPSRFDPVQPEFPTANAAVGDGGDSSYLSGTDPQSTVSASSCPPSTIAAHPRASISPAPDTFAQAFTPKVTAAAIAKPGAEPSQGSSRVHALATSANQSPPPQLTANAPSDDANGGDDHDDDSQTHFKKFAIREISIQENPAEAKSALIRVSTMLRQAPASKRRQRRTIYMGSKDASYRDAASDSKDGASETASVEATPSQEPALQHPGGSQSLNAPVPIDDTCKPSSPPPSRRRRPPPPPPALSQVAQTQVNDKLGGYGVGRSAEDPAAMMAAAPSSTSENTHGMSALAPISMTIANPIPADQEVTSPDDNKPLSELQALMKDSSLAESPPQLEVKISESLNASSRYAECIWVVDNVVITGSVMISSTQAIPASQLAKLRLRFDYRPRHGGSVQYATNRKVIRRHSLPKEPTIIGSAYYQFVDPHLFAAASLESPVSVAAFKFQVVVDQPRHARRMVPLDLRILWETGQPNQTALMVLCNPIDSRLALYPRVAQELRDVNLLAAFKDYTITEVSSRPEGYWFSDNSRMLWSLGTVPVRRRGGSAADQKSVICKIKHEQPHISPVVMAIKFSADTEATLGGFDICMQSVNGSGTAAEAVVGYKVERSVIAEKFLITPDPHVTMADLDADPLPDPNPVDVFGAQNTPHPQVTSLSPTDISPLTSEKVSGKSEISASETGIGDDDNDDNSDSEDGAHKLHTESGEAEEVEAAAQARLWSRSPSASTISTNFESLPDENHANDDNIDNDNKEEMSFSQDLNYKSENSAERQ
ncbi:hypothetical protein EV182_000412 [Spiromyces aspiralis]|uniref:Uncharacterized protein n=1 Tax=Spiromyces aspiralis TaxID=68401 RepID=A0ACC1HX39_9FUNG|nr:hypothetical protein EV182_000412 [Spiromyces aspiralis]